MNFTSKTQYGLKALMDIAFHDKAGPVQRRHIAIRQGIPTDYMDQILMKLRSHGLIHSFRGREGGYHLALEPNEISVWDIAQAVEDDGYVAENIEKAPADCAYATECITEPALDLLNGTIRRQLKKFTLSMFLDEADDRILEKGLDPIEIMETKPGREPDVHKTPKKKSSMSSSESASFYH